MSFWISPVWKNSLMYMLSILLNKTIKEFINQMMKPHLSEEEMNDILEAQNDVKTGRIFKGNLMELSEKI